MIYHSSTDSETKQIAAQIAEAYGQTPGIILLSGELGAGKTTFVQGFAEAIGIKDKVISPTFVLMRQHPIPNGQRTLHHIDLYRLDQVSDLNSLGLSEILSDDRNIVFIEWPERFTQPIPYPHLLIEIIKEESDHRTIKTTQLG